MRQTLIALIVLCLCTACDEKGHHEAAREQLTNEISLGLSQTYQAIGQSFNPDGKQERNLIYELALQAQDEEEKLSQIRNQQDDTNKRVREYAFGVIALVDRQRPGYPILPIFDTLFKQEQLSSEQQILLLACTAQLIAKSAVVINDDPTLRR